MVRVSNDGAWPGLAAAQSMAKRRIASWESIVATITAGDKSDFFRKAVTKAIVGRMISLGGGARIQSSQDHVRIFKPEELDEYVAAAEGAGYADVAAGVGQELDKDFTETPRKKVPKTTKGNIFVKDEPSVWDMGSLMAAGDEAFFAGLGVIPCGIGDVFVIGEGKIPSGNEQSLVLGIGAVPSGADFSLASSNGGTPGCGSSGLVSSEGSAVSGGAQCAASVAGNMACSFDSVLLADIGCSGPISFESAVAFAHGSTYPMAVDGSLAYGAGYITPSAREKAVLSSRASSCPSVTNSGKLSWSGGHSPSSVDYGVVSSGGAAFGGSDLGSVSDYADTDYVPPGTVNTDNMGFEDGVLAPFVVTVPGVGVTSWISHSGYYSMIMGEDAASATRLFPASEAQTYRFSFWAFTSGSAFPVYIRIGTVLLPDCYIVGQAAPYLGSGWRYHSYTFYTTTGQNIRVQFYSAGFWQFFDRFVDDLTLGVIS